MRRGWVGMVAAAALALSGCGASPATGAGATTHLTVVAAASLVHVFPKIASQFSRSHPGVSFSFSFEGTDEAVAQIEQGAPIDVFAGASASYGQELAAKHLIGPYRIFCTNQLVLVVPPSNPAHITSLADLTRKGIRLVVAGPSVPVGAYTLKVLSNLDATLGPNYSKQVLANVVSEETDVESVLSKVQLGEADAGFVYITDAAAAGSAVKAIALPASAQAVATYPIAPVRSSKAFSMAQAFANFVLTPAAQQILRGAGFGAPPS